MSMKNYTLADLGKFDGKNGQKILVAIKGEVYDVTEKGGKFYGPGKIRDHLFKYWQTGSGGFDR